ncbi:SEC10/PgrA surface exclusion domain-containing protein [Streptococcus sp. DTU_2020_1001019_1_SI_AUS_MUR_006]|uniref:SEC10/PgrA surface exclusion domain-containing protein n=1 Tax=Streptococcus sp. DTU_2020_1001019_1_SI_AUS_MUR_006 TaxID=3077584 RepID=UPI0028E6F89A|nr:SEC10/PgrA surface exclusion domain-containing protein [Streptococcus sp. DTU_2020_1001019_1_SI_AUS_MUR_006]WNS72533.1 SEC10/PgrA surface exclusion domain-containing protein [Streptococcus sp. DTU_2020_1001019_1_SI_AUS_MUR_006]
MELQKGHGTIKKLRTGAVISTLAISALGVSTAVSANETEVAVNEPATKLVAKDEVVPKVPSQADVDKAKAESDKANQDVAKQKEVVSTTETKIADAEKSIAETTQKKEEAKAVTPEKVATAKAEAEKRADELATAEKTVADADKSVSATAEKVADQTKVVSNAEKTATDTANKVADAQKKVDSLSSTTDVAPLEKEVATLTNQVAEDTQAVATAQTNLDNGKKAQSDKEQAIKDAQTGVSSAESNLSQATTALATAKANQSNKDEVVTTAQADLDRAKEELANTDFAVNTITLSQEYMSLLKEYLTTGKPEALSQKLKEQGIKELQKAGKVTLTKDGEIYRFDLPFNSTKKDQNTKVDVNNLDYETRKDLSLFAADLFNQVRKQFGTGLVSVNEDAMAIADKVAKLTKGIEYHDTKTLKSVGKEYGVLLAELIGNDTHKLTTVSEIKKAIYNDVYAMLYWDTHADWGHAQGVSHVADEPFMSYHQYLGISTSYDENTDTKIHYLGTSDNVTSYGAKFDKTKVVIAPSTAEKVAKLQEKLDLAQSTYDNALKASQEAKSAVATAQTAYTNAETALATARTNLSNVVGNKVDVPSLEKALADAKDKLAQNTKALQTAKEVLALAKSNATDKAKALAEAKTVLATAKAEQSTADQSLATAKGELEVLTKSHDVAVLARKSAGEDLARKREASKEATDTHTVLELALTKRDEVLKTLDKELTGINSKLGVLRAELKTAKEELACLEGIAEAKARVHANLKDLKDRYETEQAEKRRLEELSRKADAIRKAGGQPKEVTDATGKVVDVVDAKVQNKPVNVATMGTKDDKTYQAPAQTTNTKAEPKKQLPNTGTKDSGLLALLGASVGLFALAGKRKYNR